MERLSSFKAEVVLALREMLSAEKIEVTEEFPSPRAQRRRPCIAVGLAQVVMPACGDLCGQISVTLRFDIICPEGGAVGCHAAFDCLCDALLRRNKQFSVGEICCEEMEYDRGLSAYLLTCKTTLRGILLQDGEQDGALLTGLEINTKGM